jgi:hypothetical protein
MLYFLTSRNNPEFQQKDGPESNQTFSRINLIATTPKGFAILALGGLALALLTFALGFASGKWAAASETKSKLADAPISNMPRQFPPAPPGSPTPPPTLPPTYTPPGNLPPPYPPPDTPEPSASAIPPVIPDNSNEPVPIPARP